MTSHHSAKVLARGTSEHKISVASVNDFGRGKLGTLHLCSLRSLTDATSRTFVERIGVVSDRTGARLSVVITFGTDWVVN